jgi:hypothetical protein
MGRALLSKGHLVLADLDGIQLGVFAQELQQRPRNDKFVGGDFAHVDFPLHTIDVAGERLTVEALHEFLLELFLFVFGSHCLHLAGQLVELLIAEGLKAVD